MKELNHLMFRQIGFLLTKKYDPQDNPTEPSGVLPGSSDGNRAWYGDRRNVSSLSSSRCYAAVDAMCRIDQLVLHSSVMVKRWSKDGIWLMVINLKVQACHNG